MAHFIKGPGSFRLSLSSLPLSRQGRFSSRLFFSCLVSILLHTFTHIRIFWKARFFTAKLSVFFSSFLSVVPWLLTCSSLSFHSFAKLGSFFQC